jgi:hypothetical protein
MGRFFMIEYTPYRKGKSVITFNPRLEILPAAQRVLWEELHATPEHFTLYGGTALALHLGHRPSVDFDFFSREPFKADDLIRTIPYLADAEPLKISKNSLTCRLDRGGKVKMQFFGGLPIGNIEPRQQPTGAGFWVASLLDIAGSKVKVLPDRAEEKDYIDVDALLKHGMSLPTMLAAAKVIYGPAFNPIISLKALSYFVDVPNLPEDIKSHLANAAIKVDPTKLPILQSVQTAYAKGHVL